MYAYEFLHPKPEKLQKKPISSNTIYEKLRGAGFEPEVVMVDNNMGKLVVLFRDKLGDDVRKKLNEYIYKEVLV